MLRSIAMLTLALMLSGCGYRTWWNAPFSSGYDPNMPVGESENMQRVRGQPTTTATLTTEPGDIWPGALPPPPTLKDLEANGAMSQPQAPAPGSPNRGRGMPTVPPAPATGSSTPPDSNQPGLMDPRPAPPLSGYAAPPAAPPAPGSSGQVIQTPSGPAVTTGGGPGYRTTTNPGGGQSIVVPNGNGTSTVIHSNGQIETVPTPK